MKAFKQILSACLLLMTAWMLLGCESASESVSLDARNICVIGANDNQVKVVNEIYQLTQRETSKASGMWLLTLRIKLNTGSEPLEMTDAPVVELLDEFGFPVEGGIMKLGDNAMDTKSANDFASFVKLADGSEQSFCFYLNVTSAETVSLLMQQTKSFLLRVGDE